MKLNPDFLPNPNKRNLECKECQEYCNENLLVGPPTETTSKGLGKSAISSCQAEAALLKAAESAW